MPTRTDQIKQKALEIIRNAPQGVRFSDLLRKIIEAFPEMSRNTIRGAIWNLDATVPSQVKKVDRGLFKHVSFQEEVVQNVTTPVSVVREEDFYQPFADYLVNDLEECTKAIKLGGSRFRDKWGTPDVIGVKRANRSDIIKFEELIVSAEIKTDTNGLITAFGQACAYKIFSHKAYLVIPKDSSEEDKSRVESLCLIFGIGLIFFDSTNPDDPSFEIRVRPLKHEPDSFYVNKYVREIESELFG